MMTHFKPKGQEIAYGSHPDQVMDLYQPEVPSQRPAPLLVLVHGGAFKFGDQRMKILKPIIDIGLKRGYVVASVDYRKSHQAIFPAALADVKGAVRHLKAHAVAYGIDPQHITIWGESAGAYLSVMTALTPQVSALNGDVSNDLEQVADVQNLVSFYAPIEFAMIKEEFVALGYPSADYGKFESEFLGLDNLSDNLAACQESHWWSYREDLPENFRLRAWVQVGDEKDDKVPYLQSVHLAQRLQEVSGVTVDFKQFLGAGHMDKAFYSEANLSAIFDGLEGAGG